jgi:hypothetical protein
MTWHEEPVDEQVIHPKTVDSTKEIRISNSANRRQKIVKGSTAT